MNKSIIISLLHIISLITVLAGVIVSLYLTLRAGRNNSSIILPLLFVVWVLSPLLFLAIASMRSKRWPFPVRITLYCLVLILVPASLFGYSGIFTPPGTKTAFVFLMIPLISWLLLAIIMPILMSILRKKKHHSHLSGQGLET